MGNTNGRGSQIRKASGNLLEIGEEAGGAFPNSMVGGNRPPLGFHTVHGEHVRIMKQGRVAKRVESFCKGLAFSNRPIAVDEIVCLKFSEMATNWSGVLRFGLSNTDPSSLANNLPRFACPDLTSKEGNWAKALAERYCQQDAVLHFYVRENGELYYGINGVQKGLFLSGINTRSPLWVLVDIYGNSTALEFLDPAEVPPLRRHHSRTTADRRSATIEESNTANDQASISSPAHMRTPVTSSPSPVAVAHSPARVGVDYAGVQVRPISASITPARQSSVVSTNPFLPTPPATPAAAASRNFAEINALSASFNARTSLPQSSKYHAGIAFRPLCFHVLHGKNLHLNSDRTTANRTETEYSNGYVFTTRPVEIMEKVVIKIQNVIPQYDGGLAFGLTTCDPLHVRPEQLPDDSDLLLDRKEYWVVAKDVASKPRTGDELAFYISQGGEVFLYKNNGHPRVIMHVDHTQKLWMLFDVYGNTQRIQIFGTTEVGSRSRSATSSASSPATVSSCSSSRPHSADTNLITLNTDPNFGPVFVPPIPTTTSSSPIGPSQPLRVNLPSSSGSRSRGPPPPPPRPPNLGSRPSPVGRPAQMPPPRPAQTSRPRSSTDPPPPSGDEDASSECSICMTNPVDCVLYTCGHMCMCFACAQEVRRKSGECPICRKMIMDVIKAFRT